MSCHLASDLVKAHVCMEQMEVFPDGVCLSVILGSEITAERKRSIFPSVEDMDVLVLFAA